MLRVENQDFPELNLGVDGMGMGIAPQIPTTSIVDWNMVSFIARAEYNYKERYLLTASYRADGSSRFGAGNKMGPDSRRSLAWRINEEPFIKDLNVFYNLKLRFWIRPQRQHGYPGLSQSLDHCNVVLSG